MTPRLRETPRAFYLDGETRNRVPHFALSEAGVGSNFSGPVIQEPCSQFRAGERIPVLRPK